MRIADYVTKAVLERHGFTFKNPRPNGLIQHPSKDWHRWDWINRSMCGLARSRNRCFDELAENAAVMALRLMTAWFLSAGYLGGILTMWPLSIKTSSRWISTSTLSLKIQSPDHSGQPSYYITYSDPHALDRIQNPFQEFVVMMQRGSGDRISAQPNTKAWIFYPLRSNTIWRLR